MSKRILCNTKCKHGLQALRDLKAWKNHEMPTSQFKVCAQNLVAQYCFACTRNEVGERKAKVFRITFPNTFQVLDMFEEEDANESIKTKNRLE